MNVQSVKQYSDRYDMLPEGSSVLCAVSGGADSVALLHVLHALPGLNVVCAHYNHCLRGAESDRDEQFVLDLCRELQIPCFTGQGDVAQYAAAQGIGIEIAARKLRYAFLQRTAQEQGCTRIATAHHAGDNAETVLMHLIRGSGLRGLCGIAPVRGNIVRPLLNVTRGEIEAYLAEHRLSHVEDSSNQSDTYTRNRIRHQLLPMLTGLNNNAEENICTAAELLREDEEYLSSLAEVFLAEHRDGDCLPAAALTVLPKPVRIRALRAMCGEDIAKTHLDALEALCLSTASRASTDIPGMRVIKEHGRLTFGAPAAAPDRLPPRTIAPGETVSLPEIGMEAVCAETIYTKEIHNSFNTFIFKSEMICGRITIASRTAGDSIRLAGRGCTKTLKKLFSEAEIPLEARALIPVICDGAGVAAVCGFGVAERLTPVSGDRVTVIKLQEAEK